MGLTPFYAHDDAGSQGDRRLLVISHFFPPDSAVGARRWEKLCRYAAERGWGVDVIMRAGEDLSPSSARLRQLPPGVRVYCASAPDHALPKLEDAAAKFVRRFRQRPRSAVADAGAPPAAASSLPSPPDSIARSDLRWALHSPRGLLRLYWTWLDYAAGAAGARATTAAARKLVRPGVHRAVIATSPPYMALEAARQVSVEYGIPFIMDMRDPWSHVERLIERVASPLWLHLANRHESRSVAQAALIIANTERAREQLASTYPSRSADIITVMNGADDDPLPPQRTGGRFVIAHAGTLYLDRDPRALFEAAGRIIRELSLSPDDFGLSFIGDLEAVGGFPIHEVARQEGISEYVNTGPLLPHPEAIAFMAQATMLVTMSGSNMAAIPAKTFECVRFPAWVLALSAPGSATALLLQETGADVAAPSDAHGIAAVIRRRYREHCDGVIPAPVGADPRFSRQHQADILFDALEARVDQGHRERDDLLR